MSVSPPELEGLPVQDQAWLRAWLHQRSGIFLREDQSYLFSARLLPVARLEGVSLAEVVSRLRAGDRAVSVAAVDALTTNETSWFRDVHPFEALASVVLPERLASGGQGLSVWSAAASGGQELYSVAMLLADRFPELLAADRVRLEGTDLSSRMVQKASAGRYSQMEVDRGLPARYLVRFFDRDGLDWVVQPGIRRVCRFASHNLAMDQPPGVFDVILCRYVLIYFDERTRTRVVQQLLRALKPGGSLILGASEIGGPALSGLQSRSIGRAMVYSSRG